MRTALRQLDAGLPRVLAASAAAFLAAFAVSTALLLAAFAG